jgi:peptidoglycan/LPS O-acetylase OafA/YrhL
VRRYYWKRLLRVYPLYVVTAVVALALIEQEPGRDATDALVTLTLTDIYVTATLPAGLTQMWSLATEVAFYLVLPLLMLLALGRGARPLSPRRVLLLIVVMWTISLAWLGGLSARVPGADDRAVNQWLPAFLGWFAVGIALALLDVLHRTGRTSPRAGRALDHLSRSPGVCWVTAGALLLVAATPLAGPTLLVPANDSEAVVKILIYAAVGGLLVFTGVFAQPASRYERVMSLPLLRHLGHISYGIFCIHLPVLHLVMWMTGYELFDGHLLQILGLTLLLSLAAAELLYRAVELPFMRLRDTGPGRVTVAASPTQSTASTR